MEWLHRLGLKLFEGVRRLLSFFRWKWVKATADAIIDSKYLA